jgi:hypothetical protein
MTVNKVKKSMKNSKIIDKLDKLTLEADMLSSVLNDALKQHLEGKEDICPISYLSEKIQKKFRKIRALF